MDLVDFLPTVIGTAAIAPALLLLWLVIAADERPGPPGKVWAAFVLGIASISLLGLVRVPFKPLLSIDASPSVTLMLHAIFSVAAPEEIVKLLAIVAVSRRRQVFADPMDTVVYGAAAGLGFAAYENLVYLMHYPEMWRSLAILRSILTVPFHGALGVIAGAYLAIARSGTALGAHRLDRDWARIRTRVFILLIPIVLHASFDTPLLALQFSSNLGSGASFALECAGMLIGFGTIGFAAYLVRRVGRHHAPRTAASRERLRSLRGMWALLIAGCGAGFAGTAFVLSSVRRWLAETDNHLAINLIPVGTVSIAIGVGLLLIAGGVYIQGRNRLQASRLDGTG